jgi:hypothetical protein
MAKSTSPEKKPRHAGGAAAVRLYTLEVTLVSGPVPQAFARANPVVARTIQMRGDQTLADLHQAIFSAFGRTQDQMYEFQLGKGPADPNGRRYVLPGAQGMAPDGGQPPAGRVDQTRIDALRLDRGGSFLYWFDFAADWWHRVTIQAIDAKEPRGKYPKVTRRVGEDPPPAGGDDTGAAGDPRVISGEAAADVSCLIGELHLSKGEYRKAIEAFSRAIETRPTPDAFRGRARAYQALAGDDERRAEELC